MISALNVNYCIGNVLKAPPLHLVSQYMCLFLTYSLRRPRTELVSKRLDRSSCSHQTDPPAADLFVDQADS